MSSKVARRAPLKLPRVPQEDPKRRPGGSKRGPRGLAKTPRRRPRCPMRLPGFSQHGSLAFCTHISYWLFLNMKMFRGSGLRAQGFWLRAESTGLKTYGQLIGYRP
eukprot:2833111-Pyramimonas_sp.AAC.1